MDKESQETWKLLDVQDTSEPEDSKPNADESPDPAYAERLNSALAAAEYGRFHALLWAVCGGAHLAAALVPSVLRLRAAELLCGLRLSEDDQVLANCATYAGTLAGAPVCGLLADAAGRRLPLGLCLLLHSASCFALCLAGDLPLLAACRFLGSLSSSGSIALALTYLAEMQTSATRGAAISFMQIFWVVGCLILTALPFHWTTLSAMAGVLPLVLGLLVWKLPESARFLFSKGKNEEALESLRIMFAMNTKKDKEQFPVKALHADESLEEVSARVADEKLVPGYLRPKRFCIPVLLFARFVFVFGFHSLSQRAAALLPRYEAVFPLRHDSSNCDLRRHPTRAPQHALMTLADPPASWLACDPGGHPRNLYLAMLLLGGATVPAAVCLAYNADRLGRKFFLVVSHLVSGYVMFLWFLSQDPAAAMVLAAGYQATCSVAAASSQCFAVELASSKVRATSVACLLFAGRLGFVMADLGFWFGLDVSCVGFDIFMAVLVTLSGGMILSLPDTSGIPLR